MEYKSYRFIDRKLKWIITDENGNIIDREPNKEKLKDLKKEPYKDGRSKPRSKTYTDKELLDYLIKFYRENNRNPILEDFSNNSEYPGCSIYWERFGSWNKALAISGLRCGEEKSKIYTDKELLDYLRQFYQKYGKVPTIEDFRNNPEYPSYGTYQYRFGNWQDALKLVGMDLDTTVIQTCLKTRDQKRRYAEIIVRDLFKNKPIDLSGKDCHHYHDGICPNKEIYEVKSSKLFKYEKYLYWNFCTRNKDKGDNIEAIQWYYFAAFNEDFTILLHLWRVPGEIVEGDSFYVSEHTTTRGKFNVKNMEKYEIRLD